MSEPDVLSALRILRDAPGGILRTHRDLTLEICEHFKSILSSTDNESTRGTAESCSQIEERDRCRDGFPLRHTASIPTLTCLDGSVAESRPTDPPCEETANNQSGPSNSSKALSSSSSTNAASTRDPASKSKQTAAEQSQPVKLLKAVRQHLPKLEEFSQTIPSLKDLLEQESKTLDLRLNYIKRVDGNKTPSDQERLLKGLSQISLAKQFISWERCRGWESKVDQLCKQINANAGDPESWKHRKRNGRVSQYIRGKRYLSSDRDVIRKSICHGANQLVFMSLMEDALEDSPKAEIEGIFAAVTIFESPMFQSLKVYEFPELLRLLQKETVLDRQPSVLLMERLRNITAWSERVQSDFDSIVKHSSKAQHIDHYDEIRGSTMRVRDAMPSQQPLLQNPPAAHCRHPLGIASVGGSSNTDEYRQEASHRIRFTDDGVATSRSTQRCDTSGLESEGNLRPSTNPGISQSLSNQSESSEIPTMHPCTFPQFTLPAYTNTVIPSTSQQHFLPTTMDRQILTYPGCDNSAVDTIMSSNFPQFTPFLPMDPMQYHDHVGSPIPNRSSVGAMAV